MVPVTGLVTALVVLQGDLGTALVLLAIILGMLWVVGAPARLFVGSLVTVGVLALYLATHQRRAAAAADQLRRPVQATTRARAGRPAHGLFALSSGGLFGQGHRRQPAEVGRAARGAHRLHLRGARRGARAGRHAAGARPCS